MRVFKDISDTVEAPVALMGTDGSKGSVACEVAGMIEGLKGDRPESGSAGRVSRLSEGANSQLFVAPSLPLGWPRVLAMRTGLSHHEMQPHSRSTLKGFNQGKNWETEDDEEGTKHHVSRCAIDPNCTSMFLYTLLSTVILGIDLTLLPYILAWDIEFTGIVYGFGCVTPVFWSFDICLNFLLGYYKEGEIIMNRTDIARNYFRTWFTADAAVVLCDWASLVVQTHQQGHDSADSRSLTMLRFIKLGRMLRIVDMLRMFRVARILDLFAAKVPEGFRLVMRLVTLFTGILWLAHLFACLWFAAGISAPSDTGARWVNHILVQHGVAFEDFLDSAPAYQYLVSFHWAAGQIALGAIDIMPTNSFERIIFVLAMMFGFFFGSTLVSMLSAAMMDYQMMQKDKTMKLRQLRHYLRENQVNPVVAVHVQKQVEQRLSVREALSEGDVAALQLLSTALRSQLRFEIQRPHLARQPIFRLWMQMDVRLMQRVCADAVACNYLRPKDELFAAASAETCAHVLVRGKMVYSQSPDSSPVIEDTSEEVQEGQWLCEAALWSEWTHVGKAESITSCQLLSIDSEHLMTCLQQDFLIEGIAVEYCRQFHKRITSAGPPHAPWPTDLQVPFTDYCDLVVSMEKTVQQTIGRVALSQLQAQRGGRAMEKLREEVEISKSIVVITATGALIRVVSLVVLRAAQEDGSVFMQVGKWSGPDVKHALLLPGVKQEADEHVGETLQRMFNTRLSCLVGKLELNGFQREIEEKESKEYGVQTRYMRAICKATLFKDAVVDAPICPMMTNTITQMASSVDSVTHEKALDSHQKCMLSRLQALDVYAIHADDVSGALYAWVPSDMLDPLGCTNGERVLKAWISDLDLPAPSSSAEKREVEEEGDGGDAASMQMIVDSDLPDMRLEFTQV